MQQHRGTQQSGAVVRVGQQQTERKGVEKLLQIGVIQSEQQCRNEGARLLPVPRKTAGQQTAEHQLLTQRTDDAGTENDGRHRHLRKALVHHADRITSGQSVDHVVDIRADERTEPHQRTADDKPPAHALCACPLPAERHRRCFAP